MTLSEAVRALAAPEDWEIYRTLGSKRFFMMILGGPPDPAEAVREQNDALRARLEKAVLDRLSTGDLVATALEAPLSARSERVPVAPAIWPLLSVDFEGSAAEGHGLRLIEIRVHTRPDDANPRPVRHAAEAGRRQTPGEVKLMVWNEIESEMRRRAAEGRLTGHITPDCRNIAASVKTKFASHPHVRSVPQGRSIESRLREVYRDLARGTDA